MENLVFAFVYIDFIGACSPDSFGIYVTADALTVFTANNLPTYDFESSYVDTKTYQIVSVDHHSVKLYRYQKEAINPVVAWEIDVSMNSFSS